jgi:hypothetical protein
MTTTRKAIVTRDRVVHTYAELWATLVTRDAMIGVAKVALPQKGAQL